MSRDATETLPSPALLQEAARLLSVVAHPARLAVLCALDRQGPLSAGALADQVGIEASSLSHQLRLLREAHLVRVEQQGRRRIYALDDHHVSHIVADTLKHVSEASSGGCRRPG